MAGNKGAVAIRMDFANVSPPPISIMILSEY